MLQGRIPKDSVWVHTEYQKELAKAELDIKKGKFLSGYTAIKQMYSRYHLFFDTKELKEKQAEIRKLKGYKREKRLQNKYTLQENELRNSYTILMDEDIAFKEYKNLGWWESQIAELDTIFKKNDNVYACDMVLRTKGYLKALADNYKTNLLDKKKNFEKKMFLNILSTIIDNKDYQSYQNIISLSAYDMDYDTAIFYLEKLLENGFKDIEALYNIEGTLPLRITKKYNQTVKKHLGKAKYFSFD